MYTLFRKGNSSSSADGKKVPEARPDPSMFTDEETLREYGHILDATAPRRAITRINNVRDDGNCGYRAIARIVKGDEEMWRTVKEEMLQHLESQLSLYLPLFGESEVSRTAARLWNRDTPTPSQYWLCIPEDPVIAANTYNVALAFYVNDSCNLYVPMFSLPSPHPGAIQLHNRHFYQLEYNTRAKITWPRLYPAHFSFCQRHQLQDYSLAFSHL